jgi:hypothetical protein
VRKPFLFYWKRPTPWFTKFEFEKFFFIILHYNYPAISIQFLMYIKNWILIAVLRNWEQFQICSVFFYTPCIYISRARTLVIRPTRKVQPRWRPLTSNTYEARKLYSLSRSQNTKIPHTPCRQKQNWKGMKPTPG